jgi:NAD(P)-dependent dehydrogenase (short-subunit alcohol dehydrogenase family)
MRGLKDKVAIVAGARPGNIGGATAIRLAEEGLKVVDKIRDFGGTATARAFDITDEASYEELIDDGGLDGLFNVAADLSPRNMGRDSDASYVNGQSILVDGGANFT